MAFGELTELFRAGLELTVKGKTYVVPPASAQLGLWCRTVTQTLGAYEQATPEMREQMFRQLEKLPDLPGDEHQSMEERLLGTAYAEMLADGVEDPYVIICAWTHMTFIVRGEDAAKEFWEAGGRPEAPRPSNRAERRAQPRTGGTSTAEAATTPPAASTSGTSRPRRRSGRGRR